MFDNDVHHILERENELKRKEFDPETQEYYDPEEFKYPYYPEMYTKHDGGYTHPIIGDDDDAHDDEYDDDVGQFFNKYDDYYDSKSEIAPKILFYFQVLRSFLTVKNISSIL